MKPATWKNLPIQAPLNVHLWIAVSCICRQRTAKYIHFSWSRSGQVISIIRGELAIHMVMQCGVNGSCGVKFVSGVEQTAWGHCATAAGQGLSLPHFFFFSHFHFPSFPPFVSPLRKADKCMVKVNVWSHYRALLYLRICYLFVSLLELTCRSGNVIYFGQTKCNKDFQGSFLVQMRARQLVACRNRCIGDRVVCGALRFVPGFVRVVRGKEFMPL